MVRSVSCSRAHSTVYVRSIPNSPKERKSMLPDQPFAPETVEEQLADLKEHLQFQQLPEHTRNLRLIQDLQQLYPAHAAEPATLERTRLHLLQRLEERTLQPNG